MLLAPKEGGLNLTMDPETIASVAARGKEAAAKLRANFGDAPPPEVKLTWRNHKWVRFLAFMPALEEAMESWSKSAPSFEELLASDAPLPSYRVSTAERAAMHRASLAFLAHINSNFGASPFRKPAKRPRPEPVLRAMPRE